jgi:CRP-like cAMP-binding protein
MSIVTSEKTENIFIQKGRLKSFKKGELIIQAEESPEGVFFLQSGYVRFYSINEDGRELTLNIFKPGSYFPLIWSLTDAKNNYFFEAMTQSTSYLLPRNIFQNYLNNNSDVLFDINKRLLIGMDGLLTRIQYLMMGTARQKILSTILMLSLRFGEKNNLEELLIKIPVTHKDIANLAGLTRETTSVEMKNIESEGLIAKAGRIIKIPDLEKLRNESYMQVDGETLPYSF